MNLSSEAELISFGRKIGQKLVAPAVIELVGDVGAGKTTLTRGIAEGLGIKEAISSPSFTISKRYAYANSDDETNYLAHYDFYRLEDPGLMADDLFESISDPNTITVIEWGDSIKDLLPSKHLTVHISLNEDGSRSIKLEGGI